MEDELANAATQADRTGMYSCPHTGVALAVLFRLIKRGDIQKTDRAVVISTAHGLKFTDFKGQYHEQTLQDVVVRHAPPLNCPRITMRCNEHWVRFCEIKGEAFLSLAQKRPPF